VRRTLQPGAVFILEYANKHNLKAMLRYLARRQDWSPFSLEPVEFARLNFDFHPKAVRGWLRTSGFAIQRQLTVSHFRLGLLKRLVPLEILVKLDSLAQWSGDWWQLTPSVFVRSQAVGELPAAAPSSDLFCCPECTYSPLEAGAERMLCTACGRSWALQDGIYDFREPVR
jgi:hypothetical protein